MNNGLERSTGDLARGNNPAPRARGLSTRVWFLAATLIGLPAWSGEAPDHPPAPPPGGGERTPAWEAFEQALGSGWMVWADPHTGSPSLVSGPGLDAGGPVAADDEGIARTRARLEELRDLLGVEDPSAFVLERAVEAESPHGHRMVTITFQQKVRGHDVWHQATGGTVDHRAAVKFHYNGTLGRLSTFGSTAVPGLLLPEATRLQEDEAVEQALRDVVPSSLRKVAVRSYVSVRGPRRFLAREVEVVTDDPPHDWRFIFDAATGTLEERRDDLRHADVVGTVRAGTLNFPPGPGSPGSTFIQRIQRDLRVTQSNPPGGSAFTDRFGDFRIPNPGTQYVTVTGRFQGAWSTVFDQSGNGDLSFSAQGWTGTQISITMNPSNVSEFETAEASAFYYTTAIRNLIANYLPAYTGLASLPTYVNLGNTCNAYYVGGTINFFRSGNGCNNTAYQEVVGHEYGHAFHAWFHGNTNPAGFSEGIGDHLGSYLAGGERQIGRNFRTNGGNIRDYRAGGAASLTQWPCTNCEVHRAGEAWAGFTLDLRDNLIATMGNSAGSDWASRITIAQYSTDPINEVAALLMVYYLDDNDGNLANGSPHCAEITSAARRHGFPLPLAVPGACGGDPPDPVPQYRTPVLEAGINSVSGDHSPALDNTKRTIWFSSIRPGSEHYDIYAATRPDLASPWSTPVPVPELNSRSNDHLLCVAGNGLTMILTSGRGGLGDDLWQATRVHASLPWNAPIPLTILNSPGFDGDPSLSSDGLELFFSSDRAGSLGGGAIWTSTLVGANWSPPTRIELLDSAGQDHSPCISQDGSWLLFARTPPGSVFSDWWLAHRPTRGFGWLVQRRIDELNSTLWEFNGDLTNDDFSFFFSRGSGQQAGIYRADRVFPRVLGPTSARAGSLQTFSLRRDPGDLGVLVLSPQWLPPTTIPGIEGVLLVTPLVVVANDNLDQNGLLSASMVVANLPGIPIYFQGLAQDAAGRLYFSNRLTFLHLP